jgi:hypothetical protein
MHLLLAHVPAAPLLNGRLFVYALGFGVVLFVGSIASFVRSFSAYRLNRSVANLPLGHCDAIAVGRVAVSGEAHGLRTCRAPYSHLECLFACVKTYASEGTLGIRRHLRTEIYPTLPTFKIVDESGQATIVPAGASIQMLASYTGGNQICMSDSKEYYEEFIVSEGQQIFVYGWASDGDTLPDDIIRPGDRPKDGLAVWHGAGEARGSFVISDQPQGSLASDLFRSFGIGAFLAPIGIILGPIIIVGVLQNSVYAQTFAYNRAFAETRAQLASYDRSQPVEAPAPSALIVSVARAGDAQGVANALESGADPNVVDAAGRCALHAAVLSGSEPTLAAVLAAKPLLDLQDNAGETPLHLAVRAHDLAMVRDLLAAGANTTIVDRAKETALDIAYSEHLPDIIDVLRAAARAPS